MSYKKNENKHRNFYFDPPVFVYIYEGVLYFTLFYKSNNSQLIKTKWKENF